MRGTRLVALGSSSLESRDAPLVRALVAEGWDVDPQGVRGAEAGALSRAPLRVVRGDRVLVYLPHNGLSSVAEVRALDDRLRQLGAAVLWAEPPDFPPVAPPEVRRWAMQNRQALRDSGVRRISSGALAPADLGPDRVHLSAGGARSLARLWTRQLRAPTLARWWLPLLLMIGFYASTR